MASISISLFQYQIDPNKPENNFTRIQEAAKMASGQNSNLLILPELCLHGYNYRQFPSLISWFLPNILPDISNIAKHNSIALAGTFVETINGRLFNTFLFIDAEGNIRHNYKKVHLFKLLREGEFFQPGNEASTFKTSFGRFGAAICFDLRFSELFRKLAKEGSQLVILPAEWPVERLDHWRILLQARAIENQLFIAAVNCCGKTIRTRFGGNSMLIDPWGRVLAALSTEEELSTILIELDEVNVIRKSFPIRSDFSNYPE